MLYVVCFVYVLLLMAVLVCDADWFLWSSCLWAVVNWALQCGQYFVHFLSEAEYSTVIGGQDGLIRMIDWKDVHIRRQMLFVVSCAWQLCCRLQCYTTLSLRLTCFVLQQSLQVRTDKNNLWSFCVRFISFHLVFFCRSFNCMLEGHSWYYNYTHLFCVEFNDRICLDVLCSSSSLLLHRWRSVCLIATAVPRACFGFRHCTSRLRIRLFSTLK